jgi:hypothetical protein
MIPLYSRDGADTREEFSGLALVASIISILGWVGVAIGVLLLGVVLSGLGSTDHEFSSVIEEVVWSLGFVLGGGCTRVLIAIERNTRKDR